MTPNRVDTTTGQLPVTISDLREKDFDGNLLDSAQQKALDRYDAYRLWYLNGASTEEDFHKRYRELQAQANLLPWHDFLKENFNVPA
jgi:hypothetical protein